MTREPSKIRKWEKDRRDRIKEAFKALSKVLPCYDPSSNIANIDILQNSLAHIQELQNKVDSLIAPNSEKKVAEEEIIKKLQERIKRLLTRNEQLTNLLRDAKIALPKFSGSVKKFKTSSKLWSNKISSEQSKNIQKKEFEDNKHLYEGKDDTNSGANNPSAQKKVTKKKIKLPLLVLPPKQRNAFTVRTPGVTKSKLNKKMKNSNCIIVFSQPSVRPPCYIITNTPSTFLRTTTAPTAITNSALFTTPLVSSIIKPTIGQTLILANGTLLPMTQSNQNAITNNQASISNPINLNPKIITIPEVKTNVIHSNQNTITNNQAIISNPKNLNPKIITIPSQVKTNMSNVLTSTPSKTEKWIRPKWVTTQINKVPIPALTSIYGDNIRKLNGQSQTQTVEKKVVKKVVQKRSVGKIKEGKLKLGDKRKSEEKSDDLPKKHKAADSSEKEVENLNKSNLIKSNEGKDQCNKNVDLSKEIEKLNAKPTVASNDNNLKKNETNIIGTESVILEKNTDTLKSNKDICTFPTSKIEASDVKAKISEPKEKLKETLESSVENEMKTLELNLPHSELSNDIFASLAGPSGCQNPESTSPTAAYLMKFPLVSTGVKVSEIIDEENSVSQRGTPNLLQIGTMDTTKTTPSQPESLTPSLLNLDNFSFFNSKDMGFYNSYNPNTTSCALTTNTVSTTVANAGNICNLNTNNIQRSEKEENVIKNLPINQPSNNQHAKTAHPISQTSNVVQSSNIHMTNTTSNIVQKDPYPKLPTQNYEHRLSNASKSSSSLEPIQYQINVKNTDKNMENKQVPYINQNKMYTNQTHYNFNPPNNHNKVFTCSYLSTTKSCTNPLYTNSNNYSYNYSEPNFNQNYKNIAKTDNKGYYPYENYPEYKKNDTYYYNTQNYPKEKFTSGNTNVQNKNKQPVTQNKQPINWMTTPDNRATTDYLLSNLTKETNDFSHNNLYSSNSYINNPQTSYFNNATSYPTVDTNTVDTRKTLDLPVTNNFQEENQFSWSPTKIPQFLDPLIGDLGLNNPIYTEKNDLKCNKKRAKTNSYENQTNFLSVSQLVETEKTEVIPAKTTTRRNSGNRSKNIKQKRKSTENKEQVKVNTSYNTTDLFCENKTKNTTSNYSAEALIGHNNHNINTDACKKQNYNTNSSKALPVPPFITDNIIPYFPPVEFNQENNYMQQNQNYNANFSHNFSSTFQSNTYTSNSFMSNVTTTYIPPANNFMHDVTPHDFDNLNIFSNTKEKSGNGNKNRSRDEKTPQVSNAYKKSAKKKNNNESFDIQFLSMPGSRNSPILPDDFQSHNTFLSSNNALKNMNHLYPKQNTEISSTPLFPPPVIAPVSKTSLQPDISPSINSVGTSLANFNMCTLFPEMNKGPLLDIYPETRIKDTVTSRYNSVTSSIQMPFNNKPTFSFSYNN